VSKGDLLKQTPLDMTGNELDFNLKRKKVNMRKIPENQFDQLFFDEDDEEVVMYEDEEY
jgi:hypothetical protein